METKLEETKIELKPLGVSGLGGWLILVQIGIYLTILLTGYYLFIEFIPIFTQETWTMFTSPESELYHVLWGPIIIFETVYNILLIIFCVYILFNFYSKKWILPRLMIIFYAGSLIFGVIDYVLLQFIPLAREFEDGSSIREIFKSLVTCLIWIPYFLKSERVENTFIR